MRGHRQPFPVLLLPHVGVAASCRAAFGGVKARLAVNDGDVACDTDQHILGLEPLNRHRLRGLREEAGARSTSEPSGLLQLLRS